MFKSHFVKILMPLLVAMTMSACATISGRPVAELADSTHLVSLPPPIIEPIAFNPEPIALEVPELKVQALPVPLKELSDRAVVKMTDAEIDCMAMVMYFEARGEKTIGQISVGYVVLNRMGHRLYPKTACNVVYDKRHGCQFSWACGARARIPSNSNYQQVRQVAISVLKREVENPVGDSLFFRHRSVHSTSSNQLFVAAIGLHKFFALRQ